MKTCCTFFFSTSFNGMTLSGWCGQAHNGTSSLKFSSISPSYSASASGRISVKSSSLFSAFRNFLTCSSAGKMEVVAPISAPMLVMLARSDTLKVAAPGPTYSKTLPRPPLMPTRRSISRMTSFALQPGCKCPVKFTLMICGIFRRIGTPVIAVATSMPPTPIQSIPIEPPWGVWLSPPIKSLPGAPNLAT